MAETSVRWTVCKRIVELLQEHPDLASVGVWPVFPGANKVTDEMIAGVDIEGDVSTPTMMAGRLQRDDQFRLTFRCRVTSQSQDLDAAMIRVFELCAAFEDVVAESSTLYDEDGVVSAEVTSERQWPEPTPEGGFAGAEIVLSIHSRLL